MIWVPASQIEDLHLVRDPDTGKSKGFGFLKYEDQKSTILAVDNFNGIKVGRSRAAITRGLARVPPTV
jgi:RNA recognition motif-containing protein